MTGKGSGRRPQKEPDEIVAARWDAIFGKAPEPEPEPETEKPE